MLDKESLRKYFIERKVEFSDIYNIQDKLNRLSIFDSDNQLNMKLYFKKLSEIISWEVINSIPFCIEFNQEPDKINLVINLQGWAFIAWDTGIINADISKIITAYTIIERLYLDPCIDLNWNINSDKLTKYLQRVLKTVNLDVQIDNLPDNISYADRKFHTVYKEALSNKNYAKMCEFLSNNGLIINLQRHPAYYLIRIITKLSANQPTLLLENIGSYSPVLIKTIFLHLDIFQIITLLEKYQGTDPFPLLLGLIQIINPDGRNMENVEFANDNDILEKASYIIEKISLLVTTDNIYKYISNCSNIELNKFWHGIFVVFITRNNKYFQDYIDSIDFSFNNEQLGEYSFQVFNKFCTNDNDLNTISIGIYNKYLAILGKMDHGHYFQYTSYYLYIFHAVIFISNSSFTEYLCLLEEKGIGLRRFLYSWEHDEIYKYFTDSFYWIISSKFFPNRYKIGMNDIPIIYALLNDKRIIHKLNCHTEGQHITYNNLLNFLISPDTIQSVSLPFNDGIIEIKWENDAKRE